MDFVRFLLLEEFLSTGRYQGSVWVVAISKFPNSSMALAHISLYAFTEFQLDLLSMFVVVHDVYDDLAGLVDVRRVERKGKITGDTMLWHQLTKGRDYRALNSDEHL